MYWKLKLPPAGVILRLSSIVCGVSAKDRYPAGVYNRIAPGMWIQFAYWLLPETSLPECSGHPVYA